MPLSFVSVLAVLLFSFSSTPVVDGANSDIHWQCWSSGVSLRNPGGSLYGPSLQMSGDYGDQGAGGWGHEAAYSVLWEDVDGEVGGGASSVVQGDGREIWKSWGDRFTYGFFYTIAEQVDYVFAMNVADGTDSGNSSTDFREMASSVAGGTPDYVVEKMNRVFVGGDIPQRYDDSTAALAAGTALVALPWNAERTNWLGRATTPDSSRTSREVYLQRKSVAYRQLSSSMESFIARWDNPDTPGGGVREDTVARERDAQAADADRTVATVNTAGDGHELALSEREEIVQDLSGSTNAQGGTTNYNVTTNFSSNPVTVIALEQTAEFNEGEDFTNSYRAADRPQENCPPGVSPGDTRCVTVPVQVNLEETVGENNVGSRRGLSEGGYVLQTQTDTGHNELVIDITLDAEKRSDFLNHDEDRFLPAFSSDPWTIPAYHGYGSKPPSYRRSGLNSYHSGDLQGENAYHYGYRQPSLSRAFWTSDISTTMSPPNTEHIRWPVNFEDMQWYLYSLPETTGGQTRDELEGLDKIPDSYRADWLRWIDDRGGPALAQSGYYAESGAPLPFQLCRVEGGILARDSIDCSGLNEHKFYPFDTLNGATPLLLPDYLVAAGVASPVVDEDVEVGRRLHRFNFTIKEAEPMGTGDINAAGEDVLRRYGVPLSEPRRQEYLEHWPLRDWRVGSGRTGTVVPLGNDAPLNPNYPHLMVIVFYEALNPREHTPDNFISFHVKGPEGMNLGTHHVPERYVRRVVCRAVVLPAGFNPAASANKNILEKGWEKTKSAIESLSGFFSNLVWNVVEAASGTPESAITRGFGATCSGMKGVHGVSDPGTMEYRSATYALPDGTIVEDSSVADRNEAVKVCSSFQQSTASQVAESCGSGDVVVRERCVSLPVHRLHLERVYYYDLNGLDRSHSPAGLADDPDPDRFRFERLRRVPLNAKHVREDGRRVIGVDVAGPVPPGTDPASPGFDRSDYREVAFGTPLIPMEGFGSFTYEKEDVQYEPVLLDISGRVAGEYDETSSGLSRAVIGWTFDNIGIDTGAVAEIDGYDVRVSPDPNVFGDDRDYTYRIGRYNLISGKKCVLGDVNEAQQLTAEFNGFSVGGLDYYGPGYSDGQNGFNSGSSPMAIYPDGRYCPGSGDYNFATRGKASAQNPHYEFDQAELRGFLALLERLPLSPGYRHEFYVTPYVQIRGTDEVMLGSTARIGLNGNDIACLDNSDPDVFDDIIEPIYGCRTDTNVNMVFPAPVADPFEGISLLSLVGWERQCTDLFTATPSILTWDNSLVRNAWVLVWVLAGAVLFSLLAWQGLRMTYDVWLEPRPSVGFRELLPRFLLAVALAAGSLYLCQVILVLASDLTCFVAQHIGITMWGFFAEFFLWLFKAVLLFFDMVRGEFAESSSLGIMISLFFIWILVSFVILFAFLFALFVWVKVLFGMLMRLALLAVLIVFSPLAFAFYASDNTVHWTKRWVSMFLGTAFQQVVVIMVLYVGMGLIASYVTDGADPGWGDMILAFVMSFLVLILADKVPLIVNQQSQGMFGGIGEAVGMAMKGATMVAAVATGGALAGAGFLGGGGSGVSGKGGDDAGGSGGGGDAGGDNSGGDNSGGTPLAVRTMGSPGGGNAGGGSSPRSGGGDGGGDGGGGRGGSPPPRNFGEAVGGGMRGGFRTGQNINATMQDLSKGNFLVRHGSGRDDSAGYLEKMSQDNSNRHAAEARREERDNAMLNVMEKMNERV